MRSKLPCLLLGLSTALGFGCGDQGGSINNVAYAPDGRLIAFMSTGARVYDSDTTGHYKNIPNVAGWSAASADGSTIVVLLDGTLQVFATATGDSVAQIPVDADPPRAGFPPGLALSADGKLVAVGVDHVGGASRLSVWRVADPSIEAELDTKDKILGSGLAFSPDSAVLYGNECDSPCGYTPGTPLVMAHVVAWRIADGVRLWESAVPSTTPPQALALSADGTALVTAGDTLDLWRTSDGARREDFVAPPQNGAVIEVPAVSVAFSPDGQKVVTAYGTNDVRADAVVFGADGAVVWKLPVNDVECCCAPAVFSPDGKRVTAACFEHLRTWDLSTGALLQNRRLD